MQRIVREKFVMICVTTVKINPHTPKEDLTTRPFSLLYVPVLSQKTGSMMGSVFEPPKNFGVRNKPDTHRSNKRRNLFPNCQLPQA